MKLLIILILICCSIHMTHAQNNVYLKNNVNGHQKKLKPRTILTFKTSDSTSFTGRILSASDSSFELLTLKERKNSDTVQIQIKSVKEVTNKFMNKPATGAGIIGFIGFIGLITSPLLLITDTKEDAQGLLEVSGVFLGISGVLYSPHLIKRKYDTSNKWSIVTK
ncbi:hypothetical protein JYB62_06675 [Algoriphagus lutimaris]|uniref:hypothetical protein n=1 Tax=Algoriphagus lutimaris TaxID=613197 RepID=UPI00196A6890|nr:hypothetical protein [Algoriphagus lutimaris]MBN3519683.1 hypothetical protein [Algoriphagus lutimaris]